MAHIARSETVEYGPNFGIWRVVAATPAMLASALLLLVLCGGTGRWEGPILLAWLGTGALLLSRPGERLALRAGGFRTPTAAQRAALAHVWPAAIARAELHPATLDWYVRRSPAVNAYAAGRRSVAVTTGLLNQARDGRLRAETVSAVLLHELGHHLTHATQYMLMTQWLAAPWRLAVRAILGVTFGFVGRRQPPRLLAGVVVATVVVAVVQAEQQHNWPVVIVLGSLAVLGVLAPLANAAVSRRGERAADRFAVNAGAGHELACALTAMRSHGRQTGFVRQLLARHPDEDERIEALRRAAAIAA